MCLLRRLHWEFPPNTYALRKHTHAYTQAYTHTKITQTFPENEKGRSNIALGQETIDTKTWQGHYRMKKAYKDVSHKFQCKSLNRMFTNKIQQ